MRPTWIGPFCRDRWHHPRNVITRRAASLLALLTLAGCDDEKGDGSCEPSSQPATVNVDNRSGGLIEAITAMPCDGGDAQELTVPAEGIAFSSQASVELPGPGCWVLEWSGESCSGESSHRTSPAVCGGDTYEWMVSTRTCEGGW